MTNLQTWTRKANALKAIDALLAKAELPEGLFITGTEAADIGGAQWAVTIYVDNAEDDADVATLREIVGEKARINAEPSKAPAPVAEETPAKPAPQRIVVDRQSAIHAEAKLKVNGGKDATNPYREGTKSYDAFKLVQDNPGITRAEFVEKGGRQRTLTEDVRAGRVRVS